MVEGDSGSGTGWGGRETRAPGALKAVVRTLSWGTGALQEGSEQGVTTVEGWSGCCVEYGLEGERQESGPWRGLGQARK